MFRQPFKPDHQGDQALHKNEQVLRLFAKHMPAAVAMFDREMRYLLVSDRWVTDFRLAGQNIMGRSHYEVFPEVPERWKEVHRRCLAGSVERCEEEAFERADGTLDWVRWEIIPWFDHSGAIGGIIIFTELITQRKQQEDELRRAKEEAEQANKAKDRFLATLSHELRTPLNPVMLAIGVWEHDLTLPEQLRRDLATMRRNVEIEARLIGDLLDMTAINRGKISLKFTPVDLHELLSYVVELVQANAIRKGVRIEIQFAAARFRVNTDFTRLSQVFWNLLSNAVKFTPKGGEVIISTVNDGNAILVTVADTGIGISPEVLPRICEAFEQGTPEITRQFGGLGLGLAVAKGIVELLGGTINVRSEGLGKGATFSVVLETTASG